MQSIRIGKTILAALKQNAGLQSIVNDNIFPLVVKDGVKGPFVVYRRPGLSMTHNKDANMAYATIEIACVAYDYSTSVDIASHVLSTITRRNIDCATNITLDTASEEYSDDAYVQNLTFTIAILEDNKN